MKYWIIVASKDHVMRGVAGGFCQANHGKRAPLARMAAGDWICFYSPKERHGYPEPLQQFTALAQVKDDSIYQVAVSPEFSPFRRTVTFYPCLSVSIKPLIEQLSFIKDKKAWGFIFRQGFFPISETDFSLLSGLMLGNEKG